MSKRELERIERRKQEEAVEEARILKLQRVRIPQKVGVHVCSYCKSALADHDFKYLKVCFSNRNISFCYECRTCGYEGSWIIEFGVRRAKRLYRTGVSPAY